MKESWNLASPPIVENVKCSKHESKERRDNTELITVKSVSMNSAKNEEENMDHIHAEITMGELITNHGDNSELPPHIPPPVKSTAGELREENSDSDETRKQTAGSTMGNGEVQIQYSMDNENDEEVEEVEAMGDTLDVNTIMDGDEDIINAVNATADKIPNIT